ncbi:hypothetical protein AB4027_03270 [Alkalibacterium putridalgicola]|uniref:hypothetical protein n=1 Tax=Alkalibacterium putridalgicola TaxID=426703 RepID=UPI0034CFC492
MSEMPRKIFVLLVAVLTLAIFSNDVSAETLDPLEVDTIEQASVPRDQPYRIWRSEFLLTSASFPERTKLVTYSAFGVLYRGYLTMTNRTDGRYGALYEGWVYHPNYSGGNLPMPARVIEDK